MADFRSQIWRHLWTTILCAMLCKTRSSIISNIIMNKSVIPTIAQNDLIQSLSQATQIALDQCQKSFKWERWNCPETIVTRRDQQTQTREMAYAEAVIAAGIIHTLTKNCSRGEIVGCGCDPAMGGGQSKVKIPGRTIDQAVFNRSELKPGVPMHWSWGGCSDHIKFGAQIATDFLALDEHFQSPASILITSHNNRIGRDVVQETMIRRCMCHGVSGSCTMQTCWMQMASFATIALKLKEKYTKAVRLHVEGENTAVDKPAVAIPEVFANELLYLEESPNYCKPHNATAWKGTLGRNCLRTKLATATLAEKRSCRNICRSCGYSVRKQTKKISVRCNCKFIYCCEVKCETCDKMLAEFTCV